MSTPNLGGIRGLRTASFLRNGLYNVGAQAARSVVSLITIPLLIRFLGLRGYGVWSFAYAVLELMTVGEAGISVAATAFLSKDLAKNELREAQRTLTFILITAIAVSATLGLFLWFGGALIVRPAAAFGIAERAEVGRALQIAGFALSVLILERTLVGIEQAFDRYAVVNFLDILQSLIMNVGLVLVAFLGGRTVAMMKWQVFAWTILLAAHCCFVFGLLRANGLGFEWGGDKAWRILRYSTATWTSALGSAAFSQCDRLVVGAVLGAPLLGLYSAITSITSKINSFSGTAVQPLLPSFSRDAAMGGSTEGRIRQAVHLNALIAIQAGIFLYLLAPWVMRVVVPGATNWQDIAGLQIAAVVYALFSLNSPGYLILFSLGDARTNAIVVLSSSVISLGLILVGARYFGLLGALAGNVGYLGTWLLIAIGLKRAGIPLRRYMAWMTSPLLGLAVTLIVGSALGGNLLWRSVFATVQGALFMLWFMREHGKTSWTERELEWRLGVGEKR